MSKLIDQLKCKFTSHDWTYKETGYGRGTFDTGFEYEYRATCKRCGKTRWTWIKEEILNEIIGGTQ